MTAKMFNWVVVGASKGLGAALVQRILEKEDSVVFACARQPTSSQELLDLKAKYDSRLHLVAVDVTDESSAEVRHTCNASLEDGQLCHGSDSPPALYELCRQVFTYSVAPLVGRCKDSRRSWISTSRYSHQ